MKDTIAELLHISREAGKAILEVYGRLDFNLSFKDDRSPLTSADSRSHEIIAGYLETTGIPVLSEEGRLPAYNERKSWDKLWIVDPLDGTREFLHRNGEFTTNIALVENGQPVLGVIYAPVMDLMYWGFGNEAFRIENGHQRTLSIKHSYQSLDDLMQAENLKVVASRSHLNQATREFLENLNNPETISMGSSLKLMAVAEGSADVYPRFAPTSEWDIAAGHAIVRAAGGKVYNVHTGEELVYNKEDLLNPWFYCF